MLLLFAVGLDYGDDTDVGSGSGMVQPEVEPFVERFNTTIIIRAGSDMDMPDIIIIDDEIYEGAEFFHVNLSVSEFFQAQNILEGDPIVARVEIEDEDSELCIVCTVSLLSLTLKCTAAVGNNGI